MMVTRAKLLLPALLLPLLLAAPLQAQQGAYGDGGNSYGGNSGTYMETRVSDLENQIRTLNGRLEQAEWNNKRLQSQLERLQGDVGMRLDALERAGHQAAPNYNPNNNAPAEVQKPLTTPPAPVASNEARTAVTDRRPQQPANLVPPDVVSEEPAPNNAPQDQQDNQLPKQPVTGKLGSLYMQNGQIKSVDDVGEKPALPKPPADYGLTPQEQYDKAFSQLRAADYGGAEGGFKAFIAKNPKDKLVDNAKYWLGETYYVRGQFDAAAVAFADAYQSAPRGSKASESLLKLGMSLGGLKKTEDACTTLAEVGNRYPNAPTTVKNRTEQEMKKLKCKP